MLTVYKVTGSNRACVVGSQTWYVRACINNLSKTAEPPLSDLALPLDTQSTPRSTKSNAVCSCSVRDICRHV